MTVGPTNPAACCDCAFAKQVEPGDEPWRLYEAGCAECGERMLAAMRDYPGIDIDAAHRIQGAA